MSCKMVIIKYKRIIYLTDIFIVLIVYLLQDTSALFTLSTAYGRWFQFPLKMLDTIENP